MLVKFEIPTSDVPLFKKALRELNTPEIEIREIKEGRYEVTLSLVTYYTLISIGKLMGVASIYNELVVPVKQARHEVKLIIDEILKDLPDVG